MHGEAICRRYFNFHAGRFDHRPHATEFGAVRTTESVVVVPAAVLAVRAVVVPAAAPARADARAAAAVAVPVRARPVPVAVAAVPAHARV